MNIRLVIFLTIVLLLCALLCARCRQLHRAEMRLRMNGLPRPVVGGQITL